MRKGLLGFADDAGVCSASTVQTLHLHTQETANPKKKLTVAFTVALYDRAHNGFELCATTRCHSKSFRRRVYCVQRS